MTDDFRQAYRVDKPGIVGAKWWQDGVDEQAAAAVPRRSALFGLLGLGGALAALGAVGGALAVFGGSDDEVEFKTVDKASLEAQRQHGWNFGAVTEALVFDGAKKSAFDRAAISRLSSDTMPSRPELRPYHWPTLFEAPTAMPKAPVAGESPDKPLLEVLTPVSTPAMGAAYLRGVALARLFAKATDTALLVDLKGPESVALAAGAAERFEPVFTFDNWPHPRGVVPAHMTLAAAAYYQPRFVKAKQARGPGAPPLFVLDRARLSPYTDETKHFDNRYVAKLPPAEGLKKLGVRRVLYVVPGGAEAQELDDLNQDFVEYEKAGIDVKMVAASDFSPSAEATPAERLALEAEGEWPPYYYGGSEGSEAGFYADYGWDAGGSDVSKARSRQPTSLRPSPHRSWSPASRPTMFGASTFAGAGGGGTGATSKASKVALGTVGVAVAVGTGIVLGTRYGAGRSAGPRSGRTGWTSSGRSGGRSGSIGRSSGSGWGS